MKIINLDFEEIGNFQNIDFDSIIKQMVKYMADFNLSKEELEEIYIHLKNTIIQYTDGKIGSGKYDGIISKRRLSSANAASHTLIDQIKTDDGFKVTSGIYVKESIHKKIRDLIHELFHAASTKSILTFNNDNILYSKTGFSLHYWDENDDLVSDEYNYRFLNEGVTEMLTLDHTHEEIDVYELNVVVARILSKYDPMIVKAYFSRNDELIKQFTARFNELQSTITSQFFAKLPPSDIYDPDLISNILKACVEYSINYCQQMNIPFDKEWVLETVSVLDKSCDFLLENGTYVELVSSFLEKGKTI